MYIVSKALIEERLDDFLYIYNEDTLSYYSFNDTGVFIWEDIKKGLNEEEIVQHVLHTYDVPRKKATMDIEEIIDDLIEQKLIQRKGKIK